MGIENGGNFREVEEAEELAPEGSSNKGKTLESKVQQEQMEGNSEVAKESHSGLEAQEQKVEQEVTPESSPQLLQIGPDFGENWGYYDNQDKAILKLKEGNIEELKIELKNALESGQIEWSKDGFRRLDIPEEQKEIKEQLQIVESTIQALIQSNDNLPRDLRKTLQQEMVNDNGAEQINDKIQGRIELIRGRRRFRFFRIGRKEIQALERLRESIQTESNEYTKLQNLEQNIVDRDIIIKFQQLPESIQQSIYSLENPKVEDINKVIEAISIYQTPQELIDKREAAVKEIIDYLEKNNTDRAIEIRDEFGVSVDSLKSNERVQELAVKWIIYCLRNDIFKDYPGRDNIDGAIKIKKEFGVSVDLLKSNERVQEFAKEAIIHCLGWGGIFEAKAIRDEFGVSVDLLQSDKRVQEAAVEGIIFLFRRGDNDSAIVKAKAIRDEFGVSVDLLQSDKRVQEAAVEGIIFRLGRCDIVSAKEIIDKFGVSEERVQEAVKEGIIYWLNNSYIDRAKAIRDEFGVSEERVQEAAKEGIIYCLERGGIDRAIKIKKEFGVSVDSLKSDKRVQEAAVKEIIDCLGGGDIDSAIVKAKAIRDEFGVSEERAQEAAKEVIISRLRWGDIDRAIVKAKAIRDEFGVSDERVQEAAVKGIIYYLGRGDNVKAEAIRDKFSVSKEKLQEIKTGSEEIKKRIEMAGDFSEMIDNNFLDLLDTEEQESGLELNEKQEIISALNEFMRKNHFREKGRTILTLMMAKERGKISSEEPLAIWKVLEEVKVQIEQYESIIQQGYSNNVPSGIRASIGMEYEVTSSVVEEYENQNCSSYKNDVQLLSKYAHINEGADASHEFAFQPTDNPYLVILELKLLQDLGFIDLNFNEYTQASRGYHITLGGEFGMSREVHAYFLQNMLSCANFLGVNAGKSIKSSKGIYEKGNDLNHRPLFSSELKPMAEFKSFACDKFEMFERAILTSHNATIAIQAANKYTKIDSFEGINQLRPNFPQNSELFYSQLQTSGLLKEEIKNLRIREIIFSWFRLQVESLNLIEDHNQNFLNNETIGYFDGNNDWVEARDFALRDNKKVFEEYLMTRVNKIRGTQNQRPYSNLEEYFKELQVSPEGFFRELDPGLINTFKNINNLSLKTGEVTKKGKADERAFDQANLGSTMITKIGNKIEDLPGYPNKPEEMSIFDRDGKIRKGYYYFQGFSEKMITHKAQTLLLEFNRRMSQIINQKEKITTDSSNIEAYDYDSAA